MRSDCLGGIRFGKRALLPPVLPGFTRTIYAVELLHQT
jgi:hypothetical protein